MRSISFEPEENDLGAAYRLHFRHSIKSWRVARSFLILCVAMSVVMLGLEPYEDSLSWLWTAAGGFLLGALVFGLILFCNYLQLSRRSRRIFAQQKTLHGETLVEWDEIGIRLKNDRGSSDFRWTDFLACRSDKDVIILLQSEAMMNFIPRRILSAEQAREILALGGGRG